MPLASIYFPSERYSQAEVNARMAELAAIAARHGYTTVHKSAERGNIRELIEAIVGGEIALVLLADEERIAAIDALRQQAARLDDYIARRAFTIIADALAEARNREEE